MSTILLATDLSPHADRALDRAALLATGEGAGLLLLHVVDRELATGEGHAAALEAAEAALCYDIAEAGLPAGLAVTPLLRGGEPGPAIVQAAQETGCRLVVLAAPHADLLVQMFRASVLHHVVRHAPCPVLVVRRRARQTYRRIVVAVDLAAPSRLALEMALRLLPGAAMAQAALVVVHARHAAAPALAAEQRAGVDEMVAASLIRLAAEGRPAPGSVAIVIEPGEPSSVVAAVVARQQAELAVVGTLGLTGVANLLMGSTAEALLASLPCDVLAVRPVAA